MAVRRRCEELAAAAAGSANPGFSWTAIVCGHFFEAGLRRGYLFFDLDSQTARILDSGNTRASVSTLRCVARAVVSVLERLSATRNRALFVHSFCPTQLEMLAALERATGRTWRREQLSSKALLAESKAAQSEGICGIEDKPTVDIVAVLRTVDADWAAKEGFASQLLGLQDEKLDDAVAEVLKS
ncbi:hypothetical protein HIM_05120 [Hirsutella minnesotensis 3608]|uniref:NmrA-like domain-containing protein n=1 Tax=Hirsutella minnesotensis 3608 TaxID=1043627 RepID=A0A0F8A5J2_9HYPO|nr:hypothetical protein HIM_05120 [Hirsutella minnesotensis 3608]